MEDNLLTVEGGSGCLKELSIPAALLTEERLKQSVSSTSKAKHTHTTDDPPDEHFHTH